MKQRQRRFLPKRHIIPLAKSGSVAMLASDGSPLVGILGASGVRGRTLEGIAIGIDLITMRPGTHFPLHTHRGDHILYVLAGVGYVRIGNAQKTLGPGDTVFVAAEWEHAAGAAEGSRDDFEFLAVSIPYRAVESPGRMTLVEPK